MKHAVCRLCDHAHSMREPHVLIGGPDPSERVRDLAAVAVAEPVTVATGQISRQEAIELTERIRRTQDDWCRLVYEAHEREAWRAMGYKGWLEYVYAELPMSRSKTYQLLAHAKITTVLGIGDGFHFAELPRESQTRMLSGLARERITKAAAVDAEMGRNQLRREVALISQARGKDAASDLYRCFDGAGHLLYVGISFGVAHRMSQHQDGAAWWRAVTDIRVTHFESREEAAAAELEVISRESPRYNVVGKCVAER